MTTISRKARIVAKREGSIMRITRAQAKVLGSSSENEIVPDSKPSFQQVGASGRQENLKRAAEDEIQVNDGRAASSNGNKRRAVLKDVSNLLCRNAVADTSEVQICKPSRKDSVERNVKDEQPLCMNIPQLPAEIATRRPSEIPSLTSVRHKSSVEQKILGNINLNLPILTTSCISKAVALLNSSLTKDENQNSKNQEASNDLGIVDIDSKETDPQWCSMYALEIYNHLRSVELQCRPSGSYMETMQRDITQGMRAILIDWLVEVSDEYKLVPDTLYLTVNIIDRYLSQSYIERSKLQLLGVTCMLIASKYEEICAPRVEDFCCITDNTYSKEQVLELESQVLNTLHFQLSFPTTRSFLRRFVQAAQANDEDPMVELELLANYLADLTIMEYSFVNVLPSLIAASAVFLAQWTLNHTNNPWNPTLEFHTSYRAAELKATVIEMQDLHLNTKACCLSAVREKYKQDKFKCVATLLPALPVQSIF